MARLLALSRCFSFLPYTRPKLLVFRCFTRRTSYLLASEPGYVSSDPRSTKCASSGRLLADASVG